MNGIAQPVPLTTTKWFSFVGRNDRQALTAERGDIDDEEDLTTVLRQVDVVALKGLHLELIFDLWS